MHSFVTSSLAVAKLRYYAKRASFASRWSSQQKDQLYLNCWTDAARELNALVDTGHDNLLRITRGRVATVVWRNYTDLDGPVTLRSVGDKRYVQDALAGQQIPTPRAATFQLSDLAEAYRFLGEHECCVVKPLSGTGGGCGITTRVQSQKQLRIASRKAAGYCRNLQIEEYIEGSNLRLLFLDGVLIDAVQRHPPSVTGDGQSSLSRLIRKENENRKQQGFRHAQELLDCDADMTATLKSKRLTMRSIIPEGECVAVKTVINQNSTSENRPVVPEIAAEVIAIARKAAQCLNVRLAGVDVLTPDPTKDLKTAGGVVLEVNTTPGFFCHFREGGPNVAVAILQACLEDADRNMGSGDERKSAMQEHRSAGVFHVD